VLSGDERALRELVERLEAKGIEVLRLRTTGVAGHSQQVESLSRELEQQLKGLRPGAGTVAMVSTVSGEAIEGSELGAEYWRRNLRETVQFKRTMEELKRDGYEIYLEVSVHPTLAGAMRECLKESSARVLWSLEREQPERRQLLSQLAELYC